MPCNCGKNKNRVAYEVDLANGTPKVKVGTVGEALAALTAAGNPPLSGYRPVPA